ncbi:MAG TPA: class I adenylate-forming enzyme family protein [Acidimicrobiales bacterium]
MQRLLVGEIITTAAARTPGVPAVVADGRQLTFAEVAAGAEHLASVLAVRGVGRGDRVAWWGYNTVDAVPLFFALAHLGAVLIPVNPNFEEHETRPLFELADAALVVTDDRHHGDVTIGHLLATPAPQPWPRGGLWPVDEDDPHVIFFTSGTAGQSKGVVLSQRTEVIRSMLGGMSTWPRGATICMFPQFHMAGWASTLEAWLSSETVVYVDGGTPEGILDAVDHYRGSRLYCIPAVWRRILDVDRSAWDLSCLGQADTGTSATTPGLLGDLRRAFDWTTTTITYGSTEAGLVTRMWPQDVLRKHGSVGPTVPTVHARLENGELVVRSGHLASGYFRNPEATAEAFRDGWFYTGELAERDDEGFLYIVGRTKEIIRSGGEWVAPVEVDAVLQRHPAILEVAVAGVPDDDWGEVVTAFVVPQPGEMVTVEELRRFCDGKLTAYKHPRRLVVVDVIPRTSTTGQIQRRALTAWAVAHPSGVDTDRGRAGGPLGAVGPGRPAPE